MSVHLFRGGKVRVIALEPLTHRAGIVYVSGAQKDTGTRVLLGSHKGRGAGVRKHESTGVSRSWNGAVVWRFVRWTEEARPDTKSKRWKSRGASHDSRSNYRDSAVIYGGSGHQRAPFLPVLFFFLAKSVVADNGSPWLP